MIGPSIYQVEMVRLTVLLSYNEKHKVKISHAANYALF